MGQDPLEPLPLITGTPISVTLLKRNPPHH